MTTWIVFGLTALFVFWLLVAVFFALEIPGIRQGTPFTRYLRGWVRHPAWWIRWPLRLAIFGTIAVCVIGGAWLAYHLTLECSISGGIGCPV